MSRAATLTALRDHIRRLEQPVRHGVLPFEAAAIDAALPGGGLLLGALHEIVGAGGDEEDGAAAAGFAAGILARLGPHPGRSPGAGEGPVLWCLKRPDLYGPGLQAHRLDPARLVLVAARRDEDILWVVEEGLRTGAAPTGQARGLKAHGLAAVVGEIGRLPMAAGRRLQLAAEHSGITVLLLRRWRNAAEAAAERSRPSAAVTRWRVDALPSLPFPPPQQNPLPPMGGEGRVRGAAEPYPILPPSGRGWGVGIGRPCWRVELLRVRGGVPASWEVEVADATGHVRVFAELADRPAALRRNGVEPRLRRVG